VGWREQLHQPLRLGPMGAAAVVKWLWLVPVGGLAVLGLLAEVVLPAIAVPGP